MSLDAANLPDFEAQLADYVADGIAGLELLANAYHPQEDR